MGWLNILPVLSFTVTGKCIPLRTFLCIIFNILSISACFGKNFCTSLPVLIRLSNSCASWIYDSSGLLHVSEIACSWNGEFSSNWYSYLCQCLIRFWNLGYRCFYWFRRGSISWIRVNGELPANILYSPSFYNSRTWIIFWFYMRNCIIWYWYNYILYFRYFGH